jgi:hypothetical protein
MNKTKTTYKTEVIVYKIVSEQDPTTGEWEEVDADPIDEEVVWEGDYVECFGVYNLVLGMKIPF